MLKLSCKTIAVCLFVLGMSACSPVKTLPTSQYQLEAFSTTPVSQKSTHHTLLISQPEASPGYQTEQMLYQNKPFEIMPFTQCAWISSPASMLYPLLVQSIQKSHYFFAIASGVYADQADYRLDSQILAFQQNFLLKPSRFELTIKVTLIRVSDSEIIGSRIFSERIPCQADTPYAGVVAANTATKRFTARLSQYLTRCLTIPAQSSNSKGFLLKSVRKL